MEGKYRHLFEKKEEYIERTKKLMGDELEIFLEYMSRRIPDTIRTNTIKISPKRLKEKLEKRGVILKQENFYTSAFTILEKNNITLGNTPEHFLGYFYSQELVSMLPALVLSPKKGETILDLCAAPGSKTTQLSQLMENTGIIVANDVKKDRIKALASNCQKCGCINVMVTLKNGKYFENLNTKFDRVLLDAPCSGETMFRKSWKYLKDWRLSTVFESSSLQKRLILSAYNCLKPGGRMVYSTCTLSKEENEDVVSHLLEKTNAEIKEIKIENLKTREGIPDKNEELKKCIRVYPQDNDTGTFFLSLIERPIE